MIRYILLSLMAWTTAIEHVHGGGALPGEHRLQESQLKGGAHGNSYGPRVPAERLAASAFREGAIPREDVRAITSLGTAPPLHVYLTWQDDPSTTITINVHSRAPSHLVHLYWGDEEAVARGHYPHHSTFSGSRFEQLPDRRYLFHIELTGLVPGARYAFRVGTPEYGFSEEIAFRTVPDAAPLRFIEGGDWELTPEADCLAERAASFSPCAALLGGDYPSHVHSYSDVYKWDAWLARYQRRMITPEGCLIPMVLAIGNHDVINGGFGRPPEDAIFFAPFFKQTTEAGRHHFVRRFGKQVVCFVLDTGHTAHHKAQVPWLSGQLERYADIPVKFAIYHVPLFPSVRFSSKSLIHWLVHKALILTNRRPMAAKTYSPHSAVGQKYWLPLFDAYGMTACFEHHDQSLKRTFPMRGGQIAEGGTVYFGDGGFGAAVHHPTVQAFFHDYFATTREGAQFFWLIDVEEDCIRYRAISIDGSELDRYEQSLEPLRNYWP